MSTTSRHSPYEVVTLSLGGREIRLVRIFPSSSYPIHCQFISFPLDECPPYVALSYTWGSPNKNEKILLGPVEVSVAKNLFTFLLRVRRDGNKSWFWIDALCINQDDTWERNHQVRLMRDIYSNAERVIIWLGEASYENYDAMRLVREAYREVSKSPEDHSSHRRLMTSGKECIMSLYEHEYWTRVWIVQEILYAQKLVIYWGKGTVLWEWLARVSDFPRKHRLYSSPAAIIVRAKAEWKGPVPLADLLARCFHTRSTDIRDKVFGLLGLASQLEDDSLHADYSMAPEKVFLTTCRVVFQSSFFSYFDEMLVFGRKLRTSLDVPFTERRLVDLARESGGKQRERQSVKQTRGRTRSSKV